MKQITMFFLFGIPVGALFSYILCLCFMKPLPVGCFDLEDYEYELETYESESDYGVALTPEEVRDKAFAQFRKNGDISWWDKSVYVSSDKKNRAWLVYTEPKGRHYEKQSYMIVTWGGKTLAYWSE